MRLLLAHLSAARRIPALLGKVATWLKPGGLFVASMGSDEDLGSVDDELVGGVPMCFAGHTAQKNEELVEEADLRTVSARTEALREEGGVVTFLWIVAKKPR